MCRFLKGNKRRLLRARKRSVAARRYAASKGGSLVPASVQDRAVVDQVISIEYSYFSPAFMPVYFERMLKPAKNLGATDETKV